MIAFATANGQPISSGTLVVPRVGMWTADISINSDDTETGPIILVLGNLTLHGTVVRTSPFAGQTKARCVGGSGGWRQTVPERGYGFPSGVKLSMVLGDVAVEVGERINVAPDTSIGPFYARPNDLASFTLRAFCEAWYVDTAGVTQITSWPATTVTSDFTVIDQRPAEGLVEIATEDYAAWMPGASFSYVTLDGTLTSFGTVFTFNTDGTFRLQVMTDTVEDRVLGPLQTIVGQRVSPTRFYGRYRYTMANPTSSTVDANPVDATIGLPALNGMPLTSDSIATYTPPDGGECHVMFLDGKPTQPCVVWTEGQPTMASLLGGPNPVARLGDQVMSFLPPTLPVVGTVSGAPFAGSIIVANPITGTITQGSAKVTSA